MTARARYRPDPLAGRTAIVTGGSAGIGLECGKALAQAGASVVIVGRSSARVELALTEIEAAAPDALVFGEVCDVTEELQMTRMVERVVARCDRIDVLVAAAGILRIDGAVRMLAETGVEEWDELIRVNLTGTFLSNRAVLPIMLRQRSGQIVNVSSTSGRRGLAFDAAYCASKFGVIGLTEALAEEVRPRGIRVNALLPGAIETSMWDQNGPIPKPGAVCPVARVADLVVFLVSMPEDTICPEVVIEPTMIHERPGWRRNAGAR